MKHLSLFSGIGGIDLGFERAGMVTVGQVENDPFCRSVLERHWPDVWRWDDINTLDPKELPEHDIISGGYPCQDLSSAHTAGKRKGLQGDRSGLWYEYLRIVAGASPRWVVVENVPTWMDWVPVVRSGLARLGYASLPVLLPAGQFGAPHRRNRVFVVAHSDKSGEPLRAIYAEASRHRPIPRRESFWTNGPPDRMDDGIPRRMDRIRALGNAVVPQVAEWLGRRIMEADHAL